MKDEPTRLIVNADDFGISPGVNRGIIEAHARGIVTSTSAMTRWPAAEQAAQLARAYPGLGIGLHVDLGEWIYRHAEWQPLYQVIRTDDPCAVEREIRWQLQRFRELFGRDPDHLDSHQHAHREEPARSILIALGRELRVAVRHFSPVRYVGDFYGQNDTGQSFPELIGVTALQRILERLPEGICELCCHPAATSDLQTMYGAERLQELQTLTSAQARSAVAQSHIRLCSYSDVSAELRQTWPAEARAGTGKNSG